MVKHNFYYYYFHVTGIIIFRREVNFEFKHSPEKKKKRNFIPQNKKKKKYRHESLAPAGI